MDDERIIDLFWERNQLAIEESTSKYGNLCMSLARNITGSIDDSEEIVNEVWLALWNKIPPERPQFLKSFICKIARNKAIDRVRFNEATKRRSSERVSLDELGDILSGIDTPESLLERKEVAGFISDFLREIQEAKRIMFIQRYWYYKPIEEIASEGNVSVSKVKVTLHRTRKDLKKYLLERGVLL